jgi:hypothetical protein
VRGHTGEARKYFFFEKKKQKTFITLVYLADKANQKFFGSFFQKRTAFLALASFGGESFSMRVGVIR